MGKRDSELASLGGPGRVGFGLSRFFPPLVKPEPNIC